MADNTAYNFTYIR